MVCQDIGSLIGILTIPRMQKTHLIDFVIYVFKGRRDLVISKCTVKFDLKIGFLLNFVLVTINEAKKI